MSRLRFWLFAVLAGLLSLGFLTYFAWTWAPPFYPPAVALLSNDPQIRQLAKQADQQTLQFLDELRHEPRFTLRLSDQQLNAWIVAEFENRHLPALPTAWSQPRVRFETNQCLIAARFRPTRGPATIANARLRLSVTPDHRLGLEIAGLQAGWFPLPPEQLLEPLLGEFEKSGIPAEWRQIEGRDVLTLDLLRSPWALQHLKGGQPRLETIVIREGQLELSGQRLPDR